MSKLTLQIGDPIYTNPDTRIEIRKAVIFPQGTLVAVKQRTFSDPKQANETLREALNMALVTHPGIITIYDCYFDVTLEGEITVSIVSEFMLSDLNQQIHQRQRRRRMWSEAELWEIFSKLVSALSYAEKRGVSHRDIKPENIFTSNETIKIGDFGSSSMSIDIEQRKTLMGSPLFLSPELKRGYIQQITIGKSDVVYNPIKSDVYSLGVTMLYLALLSPPTELANIENLETATESVFAKMEDYPILREWLFPMMHPNPDHRPSFTEIENQIQASNAESVPQTYPDALEIRICLNCKEEILNTSWTEKVPKYLKPFSGFFEVVCSETCLEVKACTFPRYLCAICGGDVMNSEGICTMHCGHKYHHTCRQRFPFSDPSIAHECPQCNPDWQFKDIGLRELASLMDQASLKGRQAREQAAQPGGLMVRFPQLR